MRESVPDRPIAHPRDAWIRLRDFRDDDLHVALELSRDPYIPLVTTLPADASEADAAAWITRQRGRSAEGAGYSLAVVDADSDRAMGQVGLWITELPYGRASAGYVVSPSARGRGVARAALAAVTAFGWGLPELHRIELYIEPWNAASIRVATAAGYVREGLLRSHREIGGERRDMLLYAAVRA